MKKIRIILLSFWAVLCVSSCGGGSDPVSRMEALATELEYNSSNYSFEEWELAAEEYEQIISDVENWQLSDEELIQLARLKGKCCGYLVQGASKMAENEIERQSNFFKSALEGFLEVFE